MGARTREKAASRIAEDAAKATLKLAHEAADAITKLAQQAAKGAGDLAAHQDVCTERYGNIDSKLEDIKRRISSQETTTHMRFNTISNRMWSVMVAVCIGGCSAAGVLVMYTLNTLAGKH